MESSNIKIIFEHPLNEKMRTWLRIEFLMKQLEQSRIPDNHHALSFFHSLSELLEITERNDIRGDLIKELEEQKKKLSVWLNIVGVNKEVLQMTLNKISACLDKLNSTPKIGQSVKNDPLILSARKRLVIPGGCCCFDLPTLHLWLHQSKEFQLQQMKDWMGDFSTLFQIISFYMQLVRKTNDFTTCHCANYFYQGSNEIGNLLRIRILHENGLYPQVSGNAGRYIIRFLSADFLDDQKTASDNVEFELVNC